MLVWVTIPNKAALAPGPLPATFHSFPSSMWPQLSSDVASPSWLLLVRVPRARNCEICLLETVELLPHSVPLSLKWI